MSTDAARIEFMRLILRKLGLAVNDEEQSVPSLSRLHLSAYKAADVSDLVASWDEIITIVNGDEYIKAENDCFLLENEGTAWGVQGLKKAVSAVSSTLPNALTTQSEGGKDGESKKRENILELMDYTAAAASGGNQLLDYDKIIKKLTPHEKQFPTSRETPSFHHDSFYANIGHYHSVLRNDDAAFGKYLLYGEVLTSTNTLLEKNPSLLRHLPTGTTLTATQQIAARGRGSNVWVAPPGALMFSTVIHHPFQLTQAAPIIFLQYLVALAAVRGVKNYAPGYSAIDIKIKWPNDIYARLPGSTANPVVKIGGILVNSSYSGTNYDIVCGLGLNLANALPTASLNQLAAAANLKPFTYEKLLASILAQFESLYTDFCSRGFSRDLETEYYDAWLHTNQIVTLETHDGVKAKIKGITRDWGFLLAEELGWQDRPTGRIVQLQSDSNSFDFFKGLVRRKV
jgi:biotin--protein ligase